MIASLCFSHRILGFLRQWISLPAITIAGGTSDPGSKFRSNRGERRAGMHGLTNQMSNADPKEAKRPGFDAIAGAAQEAARKGPPPVHLWNPPFCGNLDMRIASDGTWFYLKTPIGRPALVKLFASVLKREGDKYFLVTPVEKCGIVVEDAPFIAVELEVDRGERGHILQFRTNVDDWVACGPDHVLRFEPERQTGGLKPYLHVRRHLW